MNTTTAAVNAATATFRPHQGRYRAMIAGTDPGEGLIASRRPGARPERRRAFLAATGLSPSTGIVDSLLVALPIPAYTAAAAGERMWGSVTPAALWHPLFWLPERLTTRYRTYDDNNQEVIESDDLWALRVMCEMTASGLYNIETGEWFDVLASVGIDIDNPADVMRVAEWQMGIADDTIDTIDLTSYLAYSEDPHWSMLVAASMEGPTRRTVWAYAADMLLRWCYEAEAQFDHGEFAGNTQKLAENITIVLKAGNLLLGGITSDGLGSHMEPGPDLFWVVHTTRVEGERVQTDNLLDYLLYTVAAHAGKVRDLHWEPMQEFWDAYIAPTA